MRTEDSGGRGGAGDSNLERSLEEGHALPPGLARLPAGRHGLSAELVKESQRRRILAAALELFGRQGFAATSVQGLIREARVSRATFYSFFANKEACLVALYEEGVSWLRAEADAAVIGEQRWASAVAGWVERIVEVLAEDRLFARVCTVEAPLAGDVVRAKQSEVIVGLGEKLSLGRGERDRGPDLPAVLEDILVMGAIGVLARRLVLDPRTEIDGLAAELTETVLIPYLGPAAARVVVHGR